MRLWNRRSKPQSGEATAALPRAVRRRQSSFWRRPWVLVLVGVVCLLFLYLSSVLFQRNAQEAEQETNATQRALGEVSDPLAHLCRTDPTIRARVGDAACGLAQKTADNPEIPKTGPPGEDGEPGAPGDPGPPGRGILSTTVIDGELVVNYSDGTRENVGRVLGPQGEAGADGVGITGSEIADGHLVLSFSDGTTRDVGRVVGPAGTDGAPGEPGEDGAPGADGQDGRSIASVEQVDGRLVVTYSDGTTQDAGPLPTGPMGPAGADGEDGSPAETMVLEGGGPLGTDLTCTRTNADPTAPIYTCS